MCLNGWDDFHCKVFIEVPERFISCTELNEKDYNEVLQEYMKRYCNRISKSFENCDITFTSDGKISATKRPSKK